MGKQAFTVFRLTLSIILEDCPEASYFQILWSRFSALLGCLSSFLHFLDASYVLKTDCLNTWWFLTARVLLLLYRQQIPCTLPSNRSPRAHQLGHLRLSERHALVEGWEDVCVPLAMVLTGQGKAPDLGPCSVLS